MSIRMALGADAASYSADLYESVLVSCIGGLAGLAVAYADAQ